MSRCKINRTQNNIVTTFVGFCCGEIQNPTCVIAVVGIVCESNKTSCVTIVCNVYENK